MLTTDLQAPVVAEAAVSAHLLQVLQVLAELDVDLVGHEHGALAVNLILLSVEHPLGDLEHLRVGEDRDDLLDLVSAQLTSALGEINASLLADDVRDAAADTGDGGEGILNLCKQEWK